MITEQTPKKQNNTSRRSLIVLAVIGIVALIGIIAVTTVLIRASHVPKASVYTNGKTATITYTDSGFSPSTLTVARGTTITVVNHSSDLLKFSSGPHPTDNEDPEINMDMLTPGKQGSFIVSKLGTHGFHNHYNEDKTGTLLVTD